MEKEYSQEEFNQILLEKGIDEFYIAMIEATSELNDQELDAIVEQVKKGNVNYSGGSLLERMLFKKIVGSKNEAIRSAMKQVLANQRTKQGVILTMVGSKVYNIASLDQESIDLTRKRIVAYDNMANYYTKESAHLRLTREGEIKGLDHVICLFDIEDEGPINAYWDSHRTQEEDTDLTQEFLKEAKNKTLHL